MSEKVKLTEKELRDIALGYKWHQEMSYEDFVRANAVVRYSTGHDLYDLINQRYITYVYEDKQ